MKNGWHLLDPSISIPLKALREVSKYGVFSGPYFLVFSTNTGKYGLEKTQYLDNFHAVRCKGPKSISSQRSMGPG